MEAIARQDQEAQSVIKGKRTKRQRPLSPLSLAMPNSSSSSTTSTNHDLHRLAAPSPTSGFTDMSCCTEEEEDMAHCLILLAQGQSGVTQKPTLGLAVSETPRIKSFKVVGTDGLLSYQCKTCDRSFPSFQALGGHRASHKIKPRPVSGTEQNRGMLNPNLTSASAATAVTLTLRTPNRVNDPIKSKVHECTVCGVEFSSGQALGGHMRRHRTLLPASTATTTTTSTSTSLDTAGDVFNREFRPEAKKQRTTQLELDLNLPAAPEEDSREPKFGFPAAKEQVLMFSASPLVDCCRY